MVILPKSRSQLAYLYGYACTRTFTRHLKKKKVIIPMSVALHLKDQLKIYAEMGIPPLLDDEEKKILKPLLKKYCEENGIPPPS